MSTHVPFSAPKYRQRLIVVSTWSTFPPTNLNKAVGSSSKDQVTVSPFCSLPLSLVSFLTLATLGISKGVSDVVSTCTVLRNIQP